MLRTVACTTLGLFLSHTVYASDGEELSPPAVFEIHEGYTPVQVLVDPERLAARKKQVRDRLVKSRENLASNKPLKVQRQLISPKDVPATAFFENMRDQLSADFTPDKLVEEVAHFVDCSCAVMIELMKAVLDLRGQKMPSQDGFVSTIMLFKPYREKEHDLEFSCQRLELIDSLKIFLDRPDGIDSLFKIRDRLALDCFALSLIRLQMPRLRGMTFELKEYTQQDVERLRDSFFGGVNTISRLFSPVLENYFFEKGLKNSANRLRDMDYLFSDVQALLPGWDHEQYQLRGIFYETCISFCGVVMDVNYPPIFDPTVELRVFNLADGQSLGGDKFDLFSCESAQYINNKMLRPMREELEGRLNTIAELGIKNANQASQIAQLQTLNKTILSESKKKHDALKAVEADRDRQKKLVQEGAKALEAAKVDAYKGLQEEKQRTEEVRQGYVKLEEQLKKRQDDEAALESKITERVKSSLQAEVDATRKDWRAAENRVAHLTEDLKSQRNLYQKADAERLALVKQLAEAKQEASLLKIEQSSIKLENSCLLSEKAALVNRLSNLQAERGRMGQALLEAEARLNNANQTNAELREKVQELSDELDAKYEEIFELEGQIDELEVEIQKLTAKQPSSEKKIADMSKQVKFLLQNLESVNAMRRLFEEKERHQAAYIQDLEAQLRAITGDPVNNLKGNWELEDENGQKFPCTFQEMTLLASLAAKSGGIEMLMQARQGQ